MRNDHCHNNNLIADTKICADTPAQAEALQTGDWYLSSIKYELKLDHVEILDIKPCIGVDLQDPTKIAVILTFKRAPNIYVGVSHPRGEEKYANCSAKFLIHHYSVNIWTRDSGTWERDTDFTAGEPLKLFKAVNSFKQGT